VEANKFIPPVFARALDALADGRDNISVTGLWGSSRALFLWELAKASSRPVLVVSPTTKEAQALFSDYNFFAARRSDNPASQARNAEYFPPWDVLPYDVIAPDPSVVAERMRVLRDVHEGRTRLVIAPAKALMQRLPVPSGLLGPDIVLGIKRGAEFELTALVARLDSLGYNRAAMVYEPGEFSVRGGIVDVYPAGSSNPVRMEFFGDMVESIRAFDPDTQRSTGSLDELAVLPAKEAGQESGGPMTDLAGYFDVPPLWVVDEPERVSSQASEFERRVFSSFAEMEAEDNKVRQRPEVLYLSGEELDRRVKAGPLVTVAQLDVEAHSVEEARFAYAARSIEGMRLRDTVPEPWPEDLPKTPVSVFCKNLKALMKGRDVFVVAPTAGHAERLMEILAEHGVPAIHEGADGGTETEADGGGLARVAVGELTSGFMMEEPGPAFITYSEIFGEKPRRAPTPRAKVERYLTSLSELSVGDFVVHIDHGIGRYLGLKRLSLMGVEADFLDVVYQGSDRLYVPVEELGKVQKYIGSEGAGPKLDRLGGVAWERAKSRAKKAVQEMAGELLELYAARAVAPGFSYSPDDHLFREMEDAFEYEETPDQARAVADVKADMEKPHPMDRLVCGDVGYGKTEVAVRAAFKAALDGKQAAVLVPTTLLASQHYETFSSRLAAFPVTVEMLSRFTPKERKAEILKGIKAGTVDIVIGTHRVLQKDVSFKDLGLLVIDEEHRFGVAHKEKLKQLRKQVEVLTLTATPIPRTLHMSITGIRDLSLIETPPPDRLPIKTIISRFDKSVIREAILREMDRGGQVFFVHNRIESIFAVGDMLKGIVPEARIGVAHGRMKEEPIEKVMTDFISGRLDVLLSTSIIESGLDIPAANTIIVNRADRFGLADLYQLRGRVGRSRVRAYAYLLIPGEEVLSETAQKRLRVLSELTELGAGFRLALHDLEIRGAGNILGAAQSGHIADIGFELYTRLLETAVRELKGEPAEEMAEPVMGLKVSAYIPESYVPDTGHRLGLYKRLAGVSSAEELAELEDELTDRYGPLPEPAKRLVEVMDLKVLARMLKVAGIELTPSEVRITFTDKVDIQPNRLVTFLKRRRGTARYVPQYSLFIKKPSGGWESLYPEIKNCLMELA